MGDDPPPPPDPSQTYRNQVALDYEYAPRFAQQEYELRNQYAPLYAQQQLDVARQFAPQTAELYRMLQEQIDPQGTRVRRLLGNSVENDLALGDSLSPAQLRATQQAIRGAQVARGHTLGAAPVTAEATQTAEARQRMYQQRLQNAASFLGLGNNAANLQQAGQVGQGVYQPQYGFNFVNRNAGEQGQQMAIANYNNQLGYWNAKRQNNPFSSAINVLTGGTRALGGLFDLFG